MPYLADGKTLFRRLLYGHVMWPGTARPVYYSAALWMFHYPLLWPVIFIQAMILSWIVFLVLRCVEVRIGAAGWLGLVVALVIATPVSWHVSHAMPDIFASVLILAAFLLGFGSGRLTRLETTLVVALAIASILFHVSHLLIMMALLLFTVTLWLGLPWWRGQVRPLLLAVSTVLGLAGLLIYPWVTRHDLALAPNSLPYALARFYSDGPAKAYLYENCPAAGYTICNYLGRLPDNDIEFVFKPPVQSSAFGAIRQESTRIMLGTFAQYPLWCAETTLMNFARQLITLRSEAYFFPKDEQRLRDILPGTYANFTDSRQGMGELGAPDLRLWNDFHRWIAFGSLFAAFPLMIVLYRRGNRAQLGFLMVIIVGIVANSFVCGAISGVHGRYQGRVIWLLPFGVAAVALNLLQTSSLRASALPRKARIQGQTDP